MTQKLHYKIVALVLALVLIPNLFYVSPVRAQTTFPQSVNVAVIDSLFSMNGGGFPTTTSGPTGSFIDFNFYTLSVGNVSTAMLGPGGVCGSSGCDSVLLNVASSGMACNVNSLSAQQKSDLVNFVGSGYKLIIYDSECSPQDYSWLPYTFTTANPGQQGAQGALTIVEENTLSSNDPASPYYIDTAMLGSQTDAVGDMNVMTTFDPNWFLDMSGTNILGITGPVHTYAKFPSGIDHGLIIYNGMDMDFMNSSSVPDSSTPGGNLAKVWLQELQQPFNPSQLPGGVPVVGIVLTPTTASLSVGQNHTVTATLTDLLGNPQTNIQVIFSVVSGPNTGTAGTCSPNSNCTTDANGQVSFTYVGSGGIGTDQIKGCFNNSQGQTICSQPVAADWIVVNQEIILTAPFTSSQVVSQTDPLQKNTRAAALHGLNKILQTQQDLNTGNLGYSVFAWGGLLGGFNSFVPAQANRPTEHAYIQSLMGSDFTVPSTGTYLIRAEIELHGEGHASAGPGATDFLLQFVPGELGKIVDILGIIKVTNPANLFPSAVHGDNALILKVQSAETRNGNDFHDVSADAILLDQFDTTFSGTVVVETTVQLNQGDVVLVKAGLETDIKCWGNAGAVIKPLDSRLARITITKQ